MLLVLALAPGLKHNQDPSPKWSPFASSPTPAADDRIWQLYVQKDHQSIAPICTASHLGNNVWLTAAVFYSDATTARVNHGHNGIFVSGPNAGDFTKNDTVEASGEDDSNAGVGRRQNLENNDPRRTYKSRLKNPQYFTVNTSQEARNKAADWAIGKTGPVYGKSGAGYEYNFAFNKDIEADSFNCSSGCVR
ncbi:hypothetical protein [Corynebacterium endometrii]|uniref:hypothetical protein n=1 Tax=Corynebacterium endometrii TaxID=2488819 RepID=UPI00109C0A2E|nr:hypothetical protein [Corynebacterium endometrii]